MYADRELHSHLKKKDLAIEVFGTSWITTLFSRCVPFALVFELWEIFLFERDTYFLFYFAVALLVFHRDKLLKLKSFEKMIAFCQQIKLSSLSALADVYRLAIETRQQTPASFQLLIKRLEIFKHNDIVSNEDLESLEAANLGAVMPMFAAEVVLGGQEALGSDENNDKHSNLLILKENEQQVYLHCCQAESDVVEECYDPLFRLNTLKFMTSVDSTVAYHVELCLLDCRLVKKPRLDEVRKLIKIRKKRDIECVEVDKIERIATNPKLEYKHIVIVTTSGEPSEEIHLTKVIAALSARSFVSVL